MLELLSQLKLERSSHKVSLPSIENHLSQPEQLPPGWAATFVKGAINDLKAQATHAQHPQYRSWLARLQCWIKARSHA